jgi:outer membrane protein OmpA-like peptidoglycan-associated protein
LGAVFFDTDKTTIKPEFMAMLRDVAVRIENGGTSTVLLTGFADKRASVAYNLDLARRRAQAVYAEIARQLSPEAKSRLRVELDSADPATGVQP